MKKRIISLFLVLSILLCVLPAASADEIPGFAGTYLTLNESIDINFVLTEALPDGYSVKFSVDGGNTYTAATVVKERDGKPVYTYTGLTPRTLGQSVIAKIYNGEEPTSTYYSRSVLEYCTSMLSKENSGNLKTLLVDLLNYGAAAQVHFDKATEGLVNASLTAEQKGYATRVVPTMTNNLSKADETGYEVTWASASLALENSVLIRFDINATSTDGLTLKVTLGGKTWNITEFVANGEGVYSAYFDKLNPAQMREVVTAQVFDSNGAVSSELTYSIESYANYQTNNADATDNLKTLVKQMMRYGDSTAAWVADKNGSPETPVVASVEILSGNSISVILHKDSTTLAVQAVAKDADGNVIEGETLTYSVADENVAVVDANGTLTYKANQQQGGGTTTLTVKSSNGKEDTVTVFAAREYHSFDTLTSTGLPAEWSKVSGTTTSVGEGVYARSGKSYGMIQSTDMLLKTQGTTFFAHGVGVGLAGYTVSFWVYDMGETTAFKAVYPVSGGLGVTPSVSAVNYVYYDANGDAKETSIARSNGWHEFRYVFSDADENGKGTCTMYIDGNLAATLQDVELPGYAKSTDEKYKMSFLPTDGYAAPGIYIEDALNARNES